MVDLHYEDPALAAAYDQDAGWSVDRIFYRGLAGDTPLRILDLGCGTGLLADAYAAGGHLVTGIDPARAMLDVARQKPNAARVQWVQATAQEFRSPARFDLIVMTGNAFQVFLTDADCAAVLNTLRLHLAPGGRVVFEARNPGLDWATRFNRAYPAGPGQVRLECTTRRRVGRTITFDLTYRFADRVLVSTSEIRFSSPRRITQWARAAGLRREALYGDWDRQPFDPESAEEMVFMFTAD